MVAKKKTATKKTTTKKAARGALTKAEEDKVKKVRKTKKEEQVIVIPEIKTKVLNISVIGTSELIVHRFSSKSLKQMEDKQQGKAQHKKAAKKPREDWQECLYPVPGKKNTWGVPALAFKNACVSAARYIEGLNMTFTRGCFHVLGDILPILNPKTGRPAKVTFKDNCRTDIVRIGPSKVADVRYRPFFPDWRIDLDIRYNSNVITPEQIANLLNVAGFSVGICEWRPEKNGNFGMFEVAA